MTLAAGLALTACTWMAKGFYGMPGRRVMDERLAPDFLQQMTRRYGIATLIQIAAVPVAIAAPRAGVAIALLCVRGGEIERIAIARARSRSSSRRRGE